MRSCDDIFTDQFIFRTVLARILNTFKSHKPVSKTFRPENEIFCLLKTFRFPFGYLMIANALMDMVKILFSRGKP